MFQAIFSSFDFIHFIVIGISVALIVLTFLFADKIKLKNFEKTVFYIGLATEVIKIFSYTLMNEERLGGYLPKTDLPFHLCSIQIILFAILNFSKNEGLKNTLRAFIVPTCLVGGLAAILLPTASAKGNIVIFFQYFSYHILIVMFASFLIKTKEVKFTIKDYFNTLKMMGLVGLFAIYINSILYDGESNINFMYVINPPVDGLPLLNKDHGWLVYIITYAIIVVLAVTICFSKQIIDAIKYKVQNKKQSASEEVNEE